MSCNIRYSPRFAKDLKRLAKRYRSLKQDYANLIASLREDPMQGTDLGKNLRKVRMAISAKGKGKSGGARVITYTVLVEQSPTELLLLTIYDKSDKEDITDSELIEIMRSNGLL